MRAKSSRSSCSVSNVCKTTLKTRTACRIFFLSCQTPSSLLYTFKISYNFFIQKSAFPNFSRKILQYWNASMWEKYCKRGRKRTMLHKNNRNKGTQKGESMYKAFYNRDYRKMMEEDWELFLFYVTVETQKPHVITTDGEENTNGMVPFIIITLSFQSLDDRCASEKSNFTRNIVTSFGSQETHITATDYDEQYSNKKFVCSISISSGIAFGAIVRNNACPHVYLYMARLFFCVRCDYQFWEVPFAQSNIYYGIIYCTLWIH